MQIEVCQVPNVETLTCIIPLRVASDRLDAIERLQFCCEDSDIPSDVGFLVVDDGSAMQESEKIRERCDALNIGYIRIDSELREFSVGRCRNIGAMYSKSKYILMQDVDLVPYQGFYHDLLEEIVVQGLDKDIKKFLMVPYVFLTEEGTQTFFSTEPAKRQKQFLHHTWINTVEYIEKLSTGTSANLYNRHWYLCRGGNSDDFEGWGYEDLEFNTRLVRHLNFFPIPKNWQLQKYNFNSVLSYDSWKSVYRLYGDMLFYKGVYFVHAWHPVVEGGTYAQRSNYNRNLFENKMKAFVANRDEPDPLPDKSKGISLLLRRNAFTYARNIAPLLGDIVEPSEELLKGEESLQQFMSRRTIERVVFHNPYADSVMNNLYKEAKSLGVKSIVCERGGLPDSLFYDPSGFLADSDSYSQDRWDKEITDEQRQETLNYIKTLHNTDSSLEGQPQRLGKDNTRKRLGLKKSNKVLFVPFQRPGDSVTKKFLGALGEYQNFVQLVREVSKAVPSEWVVVAKTHPLEDDDLVEDSNIVYANKCHIKDLLDISDVVLTFNSGVGLEAMAWDLPVLLAGKSYYYHLEINSEVVSLDDVLYSLKNPMRPNKEKIIRFFCYLTQEFYSFGKLKTKPVVMPDGSRMTATTNVDHTQVVWPEVEQPLILSNYVKPKVSWESYLFDRYRFSEITPSKSDGNTSKPGGIKKSNAVATQSKNEMSLSKRRLRKLKNNPKQYFLDSKHFPLRMIAKVFFK